MLQIITIGSALVDIFIHSDHFVSQDTEQGKLLSLHYGDKVELNSFKVCTGGGASNTAVGFSRLGLKTAIICETGRDNFSQLIFNDLRQEEVDTSLIISEKKEQTGGSVILVAEKGGRTVMVHRGAASLLDPFDISPYWLSKTRWVHLSSIAGRKETLNKIFTVLKKNNQVSLSWNPGKAELALLVDNQFDISSIPCRVLLVNHQEWETLQSVQEPILQNIPQVVVTKGDQGGIVHLQNQSPLKYFGQKVESVDDTGAGDAFATGYVAAQILGLPPKKSIVWGVKNAVGVIRYYGAKTGLLRRREMELRQEEKVEIEERLEET